MISLLEYAENIPRKEEFIEYLRCFTGYNKHSKRSDKECDDIYVDFENEYNEKRTYDDFTDIYLWEFVRQRQNGQISDEEFNKNERLLNYAVRKRVDQTLRTFTEWKTFFNREKDSVEKWETNNSAAFFENEIRPIAEAFSKNGTVALSKQVLADLIEAAYNEGKRSL